MSQLSPIDLQKALAGVDYPADREQLAQQARANRADSGLIDRISRLDQSTFQSPAEVSKALFKHA
ncbi:DUF2795 domain-containing protein [Peterkaempfera griseoplana]|uniref:DUF2795 domain-containing protein n=1 Tax=Peterkaempfera griseoplana TaxID=66896 RepID=UPI0006E43146|nr:DUF2795 domain-containing protein [Peterkaempfera griseoplana]